MPSAYGVLSHSCPPPDQHGGFNPSDVTSASQIGSIP